MAYFDAESAPVGIYAACARIEAAQRLGKVPYL